MIVNLVYLSARDSYSVEREEKAGTGFVDFIFYPYRKDDDCIILELKAGHTPEEALQQIKDRKYALKFRGKLGEKARYTGRILAVGIAYDKKLKKHDCRVEIIKENSSNSDRRSAETLLRASSAIVVFFILGNHILRQIFIAHTVQVRNPFTDQAVKGRVIEETQSVIQ